MAEITNPHDSFFKEVMSRPEVATEFLTNYLPPEVVAVLDLSAPELMKDSFVDPELRRHFSDLLYRVRMRDGGEAFVYILFEHKSGPDKWVAFQLLRYELKIWEPIAQRRSGELPPIFPLVFYHGQSGWGDSRDFADLIAAAGELMKYQPGLEYHVCDFSAYSEGEIKGGAILSIALLLMKNIHRDDLGERLVEIFKLFQLMPRQSAMEFLGTVLRYLSRASKRPSEEELNMAITEAFTIDGERVIAPFALTWIERGRREGVLTFALSQLEHLFGEVEEAAQAQIKSLSMESLKELGEALIDFKSPEDLNAWLRNHAGDEPPANQFIS